jgi:hypothetical protein
MHMRIFLVPVLAVLAYACSKVETDRDPDLLEFGAYLSAVTNLAPIENSAISAWRAVAPLVRADPKAVYRALDIEIIPGHSELFVRAMDLVISNERLSNLHALYSDGVRLRLDAFANIKDYLVSENPALQAEAGDQLAAADHRFTAFKLGMQEMGARINAR